MLEPRPAGFTGRPLAFPACSPDSTAHRARFNRSRTVEKNSRNDWDCSRWHVKNVGDHAPAAGPHRPELRWGGIPQSSPAGGRSRPFALTSERAEARSPSDHSHAPRPFLQPPREGPTMIMTNLRFQALLLPLVLFSL